MYNAVHSRATVVGIMCSPCVRHVFAMCSCTCMYRRSDPEEVAVHMSSSTCAVEWVLIFKVLGAKRGTKAIIKDNTISLHLHLLIHPLGPGSWVPPYLYILNLLLIFFERWNIRNTVLLWHFFLATTSTTAAAPPAASLCLVHWSIASDQPKSPSTVRPRQYKLHTTICTQQQHK